jgi:hypothetical protein
MTLQEAKDQVARNKGHEAGWRQVEDDNLVEYFIDEVAEFYASSRNREFEQAVTKMLVHFNNASPLTLATLADDEHVKAFVDARHKVLSILSKPGSTELKKP